ncbi:MAG: primosomal protein N' [Peptococcaceae bacterium]|nr:primosomal protein N' [Peptococcaceae bacterium]
MFVQVAVERKSGTLQDILSYFAPEKIAAHLRLGTRVAVPFGHQEIQGYIVGFAPPEKEINCREISAVLEAEPLLSAELVELAVWVSGYYLCSCYHVLQYMLPKIVRPNEEKYLTWCGDDELAIARAIFLSEKAQDLLQKIQHKPLNTKQIQQQYGSDGEVIAAELLSSDLAVWQSVARKLKVRSSEYQYYSLITKDEFEQEKLQKQLKRAKNQRDLLRLLTYDGPKTAQQLRGYWQQYAVVVKTLEKKGLVGKNKIEYESKINPLLKNEVEITLNEQQQEALQKIKQALHSGQKETFLLHGITGSGKTEVYLRALQETLSQDKGAIVLVPEISLTPQLIGRFKLFLGSQVEVLHSNLADKERYEVWQKLNSGQVKVVIGVRSAIFAPVQNLGLLILDEEHETTFKQSEPDPRYHARTVAMQRASMNKAVVILGSATPAIDSYFAVQNGEYQLLELTERAKQQPLPQVEVVNMGREFQQGNRSIFSTALRQSIEESLQKNEQVILLMNRRGFATSILCRECGHTLTCEKCSIALTYHKDRQIAKCHYCDYLEPVPQRCPECGSSFIRYMGSGTELVMEEIARSWPWVKALRMDMDTTQQKDAHQKILSTFASGEAQILVGTQMVAKGLDFPNVTTVGMLAADLTLNLPDYTAAEKTFQLLTQVAGRAGRGDKRGRVIVQTYNPEHYSISLGQHHDYQGFYDKEIKNRELLNYPPFSKIIRILVSDYTPSGPQAVLQELAAVLQEHYPEIEQLGPAEAPIAVIRKRYRYQLLLKHQDLELLRQAVQYGQNVLNLSRKSKTLRLLIDVEPQSVL